MAGVSYKDPAGGWTYLFAGDKDATDDFGSLDGLWSHDNGSDAFDGSKIGDSPGKLVKSVTPGTHEVEVRRAGFRPWTAKVELKGGAVETIETPEELVPLDDGPSWGGWIFTTLGVAGGGAGGYFTYLASQNDDADQKKMQETFSYIGYGVGGASLLTGILFFALGGSDDPTAQGEGQAPAWRLGAGPRPEGGGEVWLSLPLP